MKPNQKKKLYALIAASSIVVLLILFIPRKNVIDQIPYESSSRDYSTQVVLSNEEGLATQLGSLDTLEVLAADLFTFAKKEYPAYNKKGVSIGFKLNESPKKTDNTVRFEGRYGLVKNKIVVEVLLLKKKKIKLSITDSKTGKNINNDLASNSAKNQLIGTLPLDKELFSIDYNSTSDTFLITSYDGMQSTKLAAENFLLSSLKETSLDNVKYTILVARSSGTTNFPDLD